MAKKTIDDKELMKLVKAKAPVEKIDKELGIDNMAYTRTKVKDAIAKQNAADYPGLYVGKGGTAAPSKLQPKLNRKGSIILNSKILDSWGIKPSDDTKIEMGVNRDKNKITLTLEEPEKTQETPKKKATKKKAKKK